MHTHTHTVTPVLLTNAATSDRTCKTTVFWQSIKPTSSPAQTSPTNLHRWPRRKRGLRHPGIPGNFRLHHGEWGSDGANRLRLGRAGYGGKHACWRSCNQSHTMNSPSFPSTVHTDHSPSFLLFIQIYKSQPFLSTIRTDLHITALPFYCSYRSTHHSPSFCSAFHTALHITSLPSVLLFIQLYTSQPFLTFCCLYSSAHHSRSLPSLFIQLYTSQPFLTFCCLYSSTHQSRSLPSADYTDLYITIVAVHADLHITAVPSFLLFIQIYTSRQFLCAYHTDLPITAVLSFLILIQLFCSHSSSNWTEAFQKQKERKILNADLPYQKHAFFLAFFFGHLAASIFFTFSDGEIIKLFFPDEIHQNHEGREVCKARTHPYLLELQQGLAAWWQQTLQESESKPATDSSKLQTPVRFHLTTHPDADPTVTRVEPWIKDGLDHSNQRQPQWETTMIQRPTQWETPPHPFSWNLPLCSLMTVMQICFAILTPFSFCSFTPTQPSWLYQDSNVTMALELYNTLNSDMYASWTSSHQNLTGSFMPIHFYYISMFRHCWLSQFLLYQDIQTLLTFTMSITSRYSDFADFHNFYSIRTFRLCWLSQFVLYQDIQTLLTFTFSKESGFRFFGWRVPYWLQATITAVTHMILGERKCMHTNSIFLKSKHKQTLSLQIMLSAMTPTVLWNLEHLQCPFSFPQFLT